MFRAHKIFFKRGSLMKNIMVLLMILSIVTISQAAVTTTILSGSQEFDGTFANRLTVDPAVNWDGEFWSTSPDIANADFTVTWELDITTSNTPAKKAAIMMFGPTGAANTHVDGNKILFMDQTGGIGFGGSGLSLSPANLTTLTTAKNGVTLNDGVTHHVELVLDIQSGLDTFTIYVDGNEALTRNTHNLARADQKIAATGWGMVLGYNEKGGNAGAWAEFNGSLGDVSVTYVPEPATLMLLSLGGILLRRKAA